MDDMTASWFMGFLGGLAFGINGMRLMMLWKSRE
jgi:hypothetical protein